jgi:cytochrome c553
MIGSTKLDIFGKRLVLCVALSVVAAPAFAGGDIDSGKELATKKYACASCHGSNFNNPIDPSYPKLAGQHADYLAHALVSYKESSNPSIGRKNAIMASQAAPLSDHEIKDIAAYLESLPPSVITHH